MTEKITNIAKNTSYFTFALILQKVISFTYFAILARNLGPADLGKYYFAISFTTIFSIFIDIGLSNVLTREVARSNNNENDERQKVQSILGNILAIKLPLAGLALIAAAALINIMGYSALTKNLVYLSAISMVLDSFTLTFFACLRGFHNLIFESIASVVFQLIVLTFGLAAIYFDMDLRYLMAALVAASIFHFLYSASLLRFKWKIKLRPKFQRAAMKAIFIVAVPFGLFAVFQRAFMYLDSVLLSMLAGDKYVGLYQIAFKIIFALQFLPMAFTASLYPAFSSYWKGNREQLAVTFERAMKYLIIISLPISVGIIALTDKIILLFKPEYMEAILPLQLIMISLIFIFLNFPVGSLLNACDRQKINTINMGIALAVSVIMNLILIPAFKTVGASITVVAANFLMFLLGIYWTPKIVNYRATKIAAAFLKSLIAAIIMGGAILYLKSFLNIFVIIIISGLVYFVLLFLFKGFRRKDVDSIYRAFVKKSV